MRRLPRRIASLLLLGLGCLSAAASAQSSELRVEWSAEAEELRVTRAGRERAILTQVARADFRPYLHPILAPDGRGELTQFSPGHHRHQTGLYWGFTRLNGRDYFHHPEGTHWRRVEAAIRKREAQHADDYVSWRTVYDLLDEQGAAVLRETQIWTLRVEDERYQLDLHWEGEALTEVTIAEYDYGGLFLRMPWEPGVRGAAVNSLRQTNQRAEGERAIWLDLGIQVPGRDDLAHIAIFDHPGNDGYPQPWRVDGQLGVGPARARLGDWRIGAGERVTVGHRFLVYTGELDDVELTRRWSEWTGEGTYVQWWLAQEEGRQAEFLTPQRALEAIQVEPGFEVQVYASEPEIAQPMAFCWDDRGRLWIAENRDYEGRGHGFSGSGESRILILEDTDRDGVADTTQVFAEGLVFPSALAVGFGGLWVGAPPHLLFLPDADGDDRAELEDAQVRLTGWGIRDRHETLNSFHWGPDGWLYGLQGFATPSRVGRPGAQERPLRAGEEYPTQFDYADEPVDIDGGVWRYHPLDERFEVVAHGFSNPWGIDYDAKGQLFITACVIPHLWHVIPGGIYHRQGGSHFNPHVYDDLETIADHRHRSAHGGARVYLSDAFPEQYRGRLFMANIHEHALLSDVLERRGSGFVGRHGDDFLQANNGQWVGFSVELGPDGALYVLDWHDANICGGEVLNADTGRVFRIAPERSAAQDWGDRYADLRQQSDDQLWSLQASPSAWHARRARLNLQERAARGELASEVGERAWTLLRTHEDGDLRLRALWTLHAIRALETQHWLLLLGDRDEYVRAWAVQLACEAGQPEPELLERFATLADEDPSPVVRLYLASALQRLTHEQRWPIAQALVAHAEDAEDPNLPKMIWFGIEPAVPSAPERALALAERSQLPLLARHVARRLAHEGALEALLQAVSAASEPALRVQLLLGLRDSLEGRMDVAPPEGWELAFESLQSRGGEEAQLALQLARQFGSEQAASSALAVLREAGSDVALRRDALRALAASANDELLVLLPQLFEQLELRAEVIRAAAAFDAPELGELLLRHYPSLEADARAEVVHAMAARSGYGRQLTQAIADGRVPRRDLPAYLVRVLARVVGNHFLEVWGPVDALTDTQRAEEAQLREWVHEAALAAADPRRGRLVYERTCASCHTLYGEGGQVGPELTGANRGSLDYLIANVLRPNEEIQDAYRAEFVLTETGRAYSGIPIEENERQLYLRVPNEPEPIVLARSTIVSRETESISMMPEALLAGLTQEEIQDLFAYLRTRAQVARPGEE